MSYPNFPESFFTKEQIEACKKLGQDARDMFGGSFMSEAELTHEQRESLQPIGTKGLYRMYKWECHLCNTHSVRLPFSKALLEGITHAKMKHSPNLKNPPVRVIGGVFEKGALYK